MFGDFDFSKMNETDVREQIVAPLLRQLGYKHSSSNDIITEQTLKYPKSFLGRKKPSDTFLRGKADYILEVNGRLRWVIEAKGGTTEISNDDREQAFSYANHSEVRAIYFAVTNGRLFEIYRTVNGPSVDPIFSLNYESLSEKFQILANLLSPSAIQRDYPNFQLDTGKPLAEGFRSFAKIVKGNITFTNNSLNHHTLQGLNIFVTEGSVERTEDEKIIAYLKTSSPYTKIQRINEQLGLDAFEMTSEQGQVSRNPKEPSVFSGTRSITIPSGTPLYDISSGNDITLPVNIDIQSTTKASGILSGNQFEGSFSAEMKMSIIPASISMSGEFLIQIS